MTPEELKPGYEQVFTVTDYYDGPRQGVASFKGRPHFYDCIFSEARGDFSELYRLTPIPDHIFELAKEDWDIWKRWELAFHAGNTTLKSHPALPQDKARHEEIRAVLEPILKTDNEYSIVQTGVFEVIGNPILPKGVIRPLQVRWIERESGIKG